MTESLVAAEEMTLGYGARTAVRQSSFSVPDDVHVVAVIGPNGSGKSTLLHAIAGLLAPTSGSLRVLGREPREARRQVSYVLQATPTDASLPITVREVVRMGRYPQLGLWRRPRPVDRQAVDRALARMGIEDLANRQLHELSGGQHQRVLIAQGIAQPHRILMLDEPLTGLDLGSARTIDDLIHGEREDGCSIILTTHDLDEARAADYAILVSGRVIAAGPPAQVCGRANLEEAFGLGALHGWQGFLDDHLHD